MEFSVRKGKEKGIRSIGAPFIFGPGAPLNGARIEGRLCTQEGWKGKGDGGEQTVHRDFLFGGTNGIHFLKKAGRTPIIKSREDASRSRRKGGNGGFKKLQRIAYERQEIAEGNEDRRNGTNTRETG